MPIISRRDLVNIGAGIAFGATGLAGVNTALADQPQVVQVQLQRDGPIVTGAVVYSVEHADKQPEGWGEQAVCSGPAVDLDALAAACPLRDNRQRPEAYRSGPLTVIDRQPDGSYVMRELVDGKAGPPVLEVKLP